MLFTRIWRRRELSVAGNRCLLAFVGISMTLTMLVLLTPRPGLRASVESVPFSLPQVGRAVVTRTATASPMPASVRPHHPRRPVASPATRFVPSSGATSAVPRSVPTTVARSSRGVQIAATLAGPTAWAALNEVIARIPSYRPAVARWVVMAMGGWGTADLSHSIIYISPDVPMNRLYDVAVHEWSHILSIGDYQGALDLALAAMNSYYQTTGMYGSELAADCMAILQGARWTHYTQCTYEPWRSAARRLLAGSRI